MTERRKVSRARTFLGGVIGFNGRRSTVECAVRNLSGSGARVQFDNTALLPDEFDLTITCKELSYRARTVWRSDDTAGVSFVGECDSAMLPLDVTLKLRTLKARNRALKRRIAELSESGI